MAWCKKPFYECVACVCLTIGTFFLVIAFFMALGFLMGVLTKSFALPIDLYRSLWISEKRLVYKDFILKDTKLLSKLPWPSRKQSTIPISSNSNLVFLLFQSFCKHWTIGLRCFCLLKRAEQKFFVLFPQEPFFCNARHSVHSLISVIKVSCSLQVIKHLSTLCNIFSTESILEKCIQAVHVLIGEAKCVQLV